MSLTESLLHPDAGLAGLMALSEGERFDTPRRTSRNGYNVIERTWGDLNYRAVSDLNDQGLQEFTALMQQNTAK